MAYQYSDQLPLEASQRYLSKLNLVGLEQCPYKEPADRWLNEPKQWPFIEYGNVYQYLIKTPRVFSPEAMDNYRSLEAHNFFLSGWVQTILHFRTSTGYIVAKADVKPSWRVTEEPHHPWVALKKEGPVITAHCDCMAGLGETCSHVAALLFKMEAAVRLGYTSTTCTDNPCVWNECFVKNVKAAPITQIKFYKKEAKEKVKRSKRKMKEVVKSSSVDEQHEFLNQLKMLDENIVALSAFQEFADLFVDVGPAPKYLKLPVGLRSLFRESNKSLDDDRFSSLCEKTVNEVCVTSEEVKYVEEVTISQAACTTWHDMRVGRITSSVVSDVIKTDINNPSKSVLMKICKKQDPLNVPAVQWGKKHEDAAFKLYEAVHTGRPHDSSEVTPTGDVIIKEYKIHKDLNVSKAGFLICQEKPYLGVSPDGYTDCECCGKGVLEIKCPYKYRDVSLRKAVMDTSFCVNHLFQVKEHHKYFAQIQLQIYVCNVQYADFLIWTPIDCIITRVKRDDNFIASMLDTCQSFWECAIVPELLSRKIENGHTDCNVPQVPNSKTYCLCNTTDDTANDMVGCDGCDQWYHPACINLKRLPRTKKWYCKKCKKNNC